MSVINMEDSISQTGNSKVQGNFQAGSEAHVSQGQLKGTKVQVGHGLSDK